MRKTSSASKKGGGEKGGRPSGKAPEAEIREIAIDQISGSLCRMRLERDYEKEELMASIEECGVLEPVRVKAAGKGYLLFAGHRRTDCARELGKKTIVAQVYREIPDREAALIGFVDNINRMDFTPLEEGYAYRKLVREYGFKPEELIGPCGKKRTRVFGLISLCEKLTPEMEKAIIEGKMGTGAAEILLRFEDENLRKKLFQQVLKGELSVDDLKYLLARQKPDSEKNEREILLDAVEDAYEADPEVKKLWNKSVEMHRSRKGDRITIYFSKLSELRGIYRTLDRALGRAEKHLRKVLGDDSGII